MSAMKAAPWPPLACGLSRRPTPDDPGAERPEKHRGLRGVSPSRTSMSGDRSPTPAEGLLPAPSTTSRVTQATRSTGCLTLDGLPMTLFA